MENNTPLPSGEEKSQPKKNRSNEPLFGVLLLSLMIILIIGFLGGLGWAGYSGWRATQEKENQPSISTLEKEKEKTPPAEAPKPEEKKTETPTEAPGTTPSTEVVTKAKAADIKIMNGGAAKGSASVLMDVLKKDGYLKVSVGNTLSDYTGTVVYFGTGLDKEAEVVKNSILKTYPQAKVLPAITSNKETTVAVITIILGK